MSSYSLLRGLRRLFVPFYSLITFTSQKGSLSTIYAALAPEIETKEIKGKYIVPLGVVSDIVHPLAYNDELSEKLYAYSEKAVNEYLI